MLRAVLIFPGKIAVQLQPILQRLNALGKIGDDRESQKSDAVGPSAKRQIVQESLRQIVEHQDLDDNFLLAVEIDECQQSAGRSGNTNWKLS